jgi:hypothetical protein
MNKRQNDLLHVKSPPCLIIPFIPLALSHWKIGILHAAGKERAAFLRDFGLQHSRCGIDGQKETAPICCWACTRCVCVVCACVCSCVYLSLSLQCVCVCARVCACVFVCLLSLFSILLTSLSHRCVFAYMQHVFVYAYHT